MTHEFKCAGVRLETLWIKNGAVTEPFHLVPYMHRVIILIIYENLSDTKMYIGLWGTSSNDRCRSVICDRGS